MGRDAGVEWLSRLNVVDTWRLHNPTGSAFSGPGRLNRLDYILADAELAALRCKSSSYHAHDDAGDHWYHCARPAELGKGYWKLPHELLLDDDVRATVLVEAQAFLEAAKDPGVVWSGWMKLVRKMLRDVHSKESLLLSDIMSPGSSRPPNSKLLVSRHRKHQQLADAPHAIDISTGN
ncbi:hypothetical protein ACHHYP_11403 [Achlya hypogyna]|uniref:Uncharacterized protein n=1 Tax=Achlya hypogyna TaxID=1202772 RepID=A0A1V9YJ83_ACHHY|nr:hypothetical protein ACHHYP_11403 [Achlya hypogyna]